MDYHNMTPRQMEKLKKAIPTFSRVQLVDKIWDLASDEVGSPQDVLILAKESESQLRDRLFYIISWYEHLAR